MSEHDVTTVIVCGDDERLEARSECQNRLHDHPLPAGYVQAHAEASRRLNNRWSNKRCPDCHAYGWEARHV